MSGCCCPRFGVFERHGAIPHFAAGDGKQCPNKSITEVSQCNPAIGELVVSRYDKPLLKAGTLNPWSKWGECGAYCAGGQRANARAVLARANVNGRTCDCTLSEVGPCNWVLAVECALIASGVNGPFRVIAPSVVVSIAVSVPSGSCRSLAVRGALLAIPR